MIKVLTREQKVARFHHAMGLDVNSQPRESLLELRKKLIQEETAEVEEQVKEELSKTPAVEPISHNPEAKQEFKVRFGQNRKETALDRVMKKLTN